MVGRYGNDELNGFLSFLTLALIIVNLFVRSQIPFMLEILCLILCYLRMLSRNVNARFRENQKFLDIRFRMEELWKRWMKQRKEGRGYKIFKCPGCGQKIRIPRGHGKISIHCRKCGKDFMGRS